MKLLDRSVEAFAAQIPNLDAAISATGCKYARATGLKSCLLQGGYVTGHGVYRALGRHVDDLTRLVSRCGRQE